MAALTLDVDLGEVTARLDAVQDVQAEILRQLAVIGTRLGDMATQDDVDALAGRMRTMADDIAARQSALAAAVTGIRADLQALKAAGTVNTTSLEANVTAAENALAGMGTAVADAAALDAENPPPA